MVPLEAPAIVNDKLHPGRLSEVARCVFATGWERGRSLQRSRERKREGWEVSGGSHSSGVPSVGEQRELQARERKARFGPPGRVFKG